MCSVHVSDRGMEARGIWCPWSQGAVKPWCGCWKPSSGPLREQDVLWTAKPSLQPPFCLFLFLLLSALSSATGMDLEFSSLLYNDGVFQGCTKSQILLIDYYLLNGLWKLRVQFPALKCWLITIHNSHSRRSNAFFWPCRHQAWMWHTDIHAGRTLTHKIKWINIIKANKKAGKHASKRRAVFC